MKTALALALAVVVLAGCECGPGVSCKSDSDCASGTRCEMLGGKSGHCALIPNFDAGTDSGTPDAGDMDAGAVDAGAPQAMISAAPIDFGQVGCGKAAVMKELEIFNTGSGPLAYSAALNGSTAFTMGASSGTVEAGMSVKLSVSAAALGSATAGVDQVGTLTVTTNDPLLPKTDVALKMTASGVTLGLTPGIASFGLVPVLSNAPAVPLTLTNQGNVPATVTVANPADPQFSVTWTGAPAAFTILPGGSAAGLSAGFLPTKSTPSSGSAVISVNEAICGISVATIPLTGQGTNGAVGISTSDVFFGNSGRVPCGTTAASKTFVLSNTGNQAFSWTGTLAKGAASPITITAAPIPGQATTAEEAFGDTLSIVTDAANDSSHPIALHQTASGAVLAFAPGQVDFGMVPVNNTANAPLSVVNDGNSPASVTLMSSSASFSVAPPGPIPVAGTSFHAFTGTFAPGNSVVQQNANISLAVDGGDVLCAPLPSPMTMTGIGTNGSISYTPVALEFGSVNCGTTAAPKTVTFSNSGNQDYTVVPTLGKGAASAFTVAMAPVSGVVGQDGGTLVITVTPKQIPAMSAVTPNLYGDTLTVTSDVAGDSPHTLPLRETARGSIFAISSDNFGFGTVAVGATASSQFTLSNSGNAQGTLRFMPVQPSIFSLPPNVVLSAAASSIENAAFSPMAPVAYSDMAAVSVAPGTVLCQPLPYSAISLSGTGTTSNVVMLSASSLTFGTGGLVPCGTQAPAKTINVTNNSNLTLTFAFTLAGGAGSPYSVTGPATLAAGTSGVVTVTPKAIPATSSTTPDGFGDSLSVNATGGPVNESHIVDLHQTAQGAILAFNPGGLSFTSSGTKNFTVDNTGNLSAPYTLTKSGTHANDWTISPTAGTAPGGGSVSSSATFARPLLGGNRSASVSMSTSVVRCAPLPSPLTLSGS
jgi:hypothetical protein